MPMMRVMHFEFAADNPERAIKFYKSVFGWKIEGWGDSPTYWLVTTGPDGEPGINGAIMGRKEAPASVINTVTVPSVDDFGKKIVKSGGKLVTPKMPIPGIGYFAYYKDTEGNVFGILQPDSSVKASQQ